VFVCVCVFVFCACVHVCVCALACVNKAESKQHHVTTLATDWTMATFVVSVCQFPEATKVYSRTVLLSIYGKDGVDYVIWTYH
jgi:hypothetical protein